MADKTKKELISTIEKQEKQIEKLLDENSSLWLMLDELDKSNVTNPEYFKHVASAIKNIRRSKLMTPKKIGEA